MVVRVNKDSDAKARNVINRTSVGGNHTKLLAPVLILCMTVISLKSSIQETSQFNLVGSIRFDMLYDAKENQIMDKSQQHQQLSATLLSSSSTTSRNNGQVNTTYSGEIQLLLPPEQIQWMKNRVAYFNSFYEIPFNKNGTEERLFAPADNNGPILDFVVAGFPKCGEL
jgi:hypothetical protein